MTLLRETGVARTEKRVMRKANLVTIVLLSFGFTQPSGVTAQKGSSVEGVAKDIIALERAALDRYIALDPQGYLSLYAPEVTYFDPMTERRVDGLKAMQEWLAPMKNAKVPFTDRRYEMIGPRVQRYGDVALLTFNIVNYGKPPNKAEQPLTRWNSTEVYRRVDGKWVIVHSHWSFIKPDVKLAGL